MWEALGEFRTWIWQNIRLYDPSEPLGVSFCDCVRKRSQILPDLLCLRAIGSSTPFQSMRPLCKKGLNSSDSFGF